MPDMQKMSRMPENGQEQQKQPPIAEFEGYTECPLFSEMCRIPLIKKGWPLPDVSTSFPSCTARYKALRHRSSNCDWKQQAARWYFPGWDRS